MLGARLGETKREESATIPIASVKVNCDESNRLSRRAAAIHRRDAIAACRGIVGRDYRASVFNSLRVLIARKNVDVFGRAARYNRDTLSTRNLFSSRGNKREIMYSINLFLNSPRNITHAAFSLATTSQ